MDKRGIFATLDPFFEGGGIMGRTVANAGFMRALLLADPFREYHFFLPSEEAMRAARQGAEAIRPDLVEEGRLRLAFRQELPARLADTAFHCLHLSDCLTSQPHVPRLRALHSRAVFPVTGTTHSLSRADYAQALLPHFSPATTPRDCIVCTSSAAESAVGRLFSHLRSGLGLDEDRFPGPSLRRVPLGVDTGELEPASHGERAAARAEWGLDEAPAALCLGRLSHHAKMDLLPLLQAARRLKADGTELTLLLAGWATEEDEPFLDTLRELAANAGLDARVLPRPGEAEKRSLFQAADFFVSPSDNPQETFGLTMLEAAACGLPVVASDYDGYRDLVLDGETGLLVPTLFREHTEADDALARVLYDNQYHLLLSQTTAVDVPALARAMERLATDPGLRREMGAAARTRAEEYGWSRVVEMHLDLWDELWRLDPGKPGDAPHPLHVPYGRVFADFPSQSGLTGTTLVWSGYGRAVYQGRDFPLIYGGLSHVVTPELVKALLFRARKPMDGAELAALLAATQQLSADEAESLVVWALKQDLLERA
nr:glycosyltransferase family 4 protein [Desulfohalovibrio reitneri]